MDPIIASIVVASIGLFGSLAVAVIASRSKASNERVASLEKEVAALTKKLDDCKEALSSQLAENTKLMKDLLATQMKLMFPELGEKK